MRLFAALPALLLIFSTIASSSSSLASSSSSTPPNSLSCLDASGSPVDWWFALKHPGGDRYSYLDSGSDPRGEGFEGGGEGGGARRGLASAAEGPLARTLL